MNRYSKYKYPYGSDHSSFNFWPLFVDLGLAGLLLAFMGMGYYGMNRPAPQVVEKIVVQQAPQQLEEKRTARNTGFSAIFDREFAQELNTGAIRTKAEGNQQRITFGNELLFDKGSYDFRPEGRRALQRCLQIIDEFQQDESYLLTKVMVEGHTDSTRIHNSPSNPLHAKGIRDNWDLAAARANNVVRYFVDNSNLDPTLFSSSAFSWYQYNPSEGSMDRNRKVEIVLEYED